MAADGFFSKTFDGVFEFWMTQSLEVAACEQVFVQSNGSERSKNPFGHWGFDRAEFVYPTAFVPIKLSL